MPTRNASCSCGQLTASVTGDPVRVSICHCLACQRRTGSVFGAQARFPKDTVTIAGTSTVFERTGDSGSTARFHFCPRCGATVYYTFVAIPEVIALPVGVFADPAFPAPAFSVYEERKHGWVALPDGIDHLH
ncbi:MAG: GFA family protein [Kofleriaceae bacterium]